MKNDDVRFSFTDKAERELHRAYAKGKGISLSALASLALHQYESKYPLRAPQLAIAVSEYVKAMSDAKTVQSHAIGMKSGR
jgi:hypothetical protein